MFDQLDNVRSAWIENRVTMLVNPVNPGSEVEKVTLVAPTTIFSLEMLDQMRSIGNNIAEVVISYELCKTLELPFIRTVYRAVSSRYPIIDYFMKQEASNQEISKSAYSMLIDAVNSEYGNTDKDRLQTIQQIGDLIDQFDNHELKKKEFVDKFRKSFKIPGYVPVIRSSLHSLKSKVSTYELSIALTEIAKYPATAVICDMIDLKDGSFLRPDKAEKISTKLNVPMIDTKTTIDLWRSIFKVPKNEIADY
ncbi:MAG: 3,4-dihydroxy-2-butanone-4-phosphate synthase [Candidatus Kariarchaeaceae archaeon]